MIPGEGAGAREQLPPIQGGVLNDLDQLMNTLGSQQVISFFNFVVDIHQNILVSGFEQPLGGLLCCFADGVIRLETPVLLPIDNMSGNSRRQNLKNIRSHLEQEGAVIIFPAGEV